MFWFHIINQLGNALLAIQSEEVTSSSQFQVVDIPHWPISALYSSRILVSFNRLVTCSLVYKVCLANHTVELCLPPSVNQPIRACFTSFPRLDVDSIIKMSGVFLNSNIELTIFHKRFSYYKPYTVSCQVEWWRN